MSPVWQRPNRPYLTGQEKYPAYPPIQEDLILSGLKGPGQSQSQLQRGPQDEIVFGRKGKRGREAKVPQTNIFGGPSLALSLLTLTIHSDILKALRSPATEKPLLFLYLGHRISAVFVLWWWWWWW